MYETGEISPNLYCSKTGEFIESVNCNEFFTKLDVPWVFSYNETNYAFTPIRDDKGFLSINYDGEIKISDDFVFYEEKDHKIVISNVKSDFGLYLQTNTLSKQIMIFASFMNFTYLKIGSVLIISNHEEIVFIKLEGFDFVRKVMPEGFFAERSLSSIFRGDNNTVLIGGYTERKEYCFAVMNIMNGEFLDILYTHAINPCLYKEDGFLVCKDRKIVDLKKSSNIKF